MSKPLEYCICGSRPERHQDANGKWFVYCEECALAFGLKIEPCETYIPGTGEAIFDTAEDARAAWDEWVASAEE